MGRFALVVRFADGIKYPPHEYVTPMPHPDTERANRAWVETWGGLSHVARNNVLVQRKVDIPRRSAVVAVERNL